MLIVIVFLGGKNSSKNLSKPPTCSSATACACPSPITQDQLHQASPISLKPTAKEGSATPHVTKLVKNTFSWAKDATDAGRDHER